VAGCCECDDEPSGSCATEFVNVKLYIRLSFVIKFMTCFYFDKKLALRYDIYVSRHVKYVALGNLSN
jgi:hypothetical protein